MPHTKKKSTLKLDHLPVFSCNSTFVSCHPTLVGQGTNIWQRWPAAKACFCDLSNVFIFENTRRCPGCLWNFPLLLIQRLKNLSPSCLGLNTLPPFDFTFIFLVSLWYKMDLFVILHITLLLFCCWIIFFSSACFHLSKSSLLCFLSVLFLPPFLFFPLLLCYSSYTITGLLVVTQPVCQHSEWSSADSHGALREAERRTLTHRVLSIYDTVIESHVQSGAYVV